MNGVYSVKLTSADLETVLSCIMQTGVLITDISREDEMSCVFSLSSREYPQIQKIAEKHNDELEILNRKGLVWCFASILRRPTVLVIILILFLASMLIPQRILFVEVQGNKEIEAEWIRSIAAESGVVPGALRKKLRSEDIKNHMLERIPQLSWMGLNTKGCIALISVSEKTSSGNEQADSPGHIYAGVDGLVERVTATEGMAKCRPGDAVARGQILIAGSRECGDLLLQTRAAGDVIGITNRSLYAVSPADSVKKQGDKDSDWHISLILGKKRINLWKDSGICYGSCGRMYKECWLKLPGGFPLPVCLAIEKTDRWEDELSISSNCEELLSSFASSHLMAAMISGQILDQNVSIFRSGDIWCLEGAYLCREQLGVFQEERIGEEYGKND